MARFDTRGILDENGNQIGQEQVPFAPQEEADHDAEAAANAAAQPLLDWGKQMAATDREMPRYLEDLIDNQNMTLKPGRLNDNYTAKKALRGQKP